MDKFDRETLDALDKAEEVHVETGGGGSPGTVIWAVVVDDSVFVRSVRGEKGRWYREASANQEAALRVDDRRILVRAEPETDAATIGKVSAAYREKYEASYPGPTAAMLREEVLATTLRLLPA
jgi:hypothetical protein